MTEPEVDVPAPPKSRAGRDLRAAVGVGLLLGGLVVGTLVISKAAFLPVLVVAICVGAWEMRQALAGMLWSKQFFFFSPSF